MSPASQRHAIAGVNTPPDHAPRPPSQTRPCGGWVLLGCVAAATTGCASLPLTPPTAEAATTVQPTAPASSKPSLTEVSQADGMYAQGRHAEAAQAFQALVQQVPRNAYFWFRLGSCQLRLQQAAEAIQSLQQARALDPMDGRYAYNLALAHAALARDAFAQARAQLPPQSPWRQEAEQHRLMLEAVTGPAMAVTAPVQAR